MVTKKKTKPTFELRLEPAGESGYTLTLYQAHSGSASNGQEPFSKIEKLSGDRLRAAMEQVLHALRQNGYRPSDLSRTRREPFLLGEEDGVRLGVLFLGIRPLRKFSRIESISERVKGMEPEELYYWFSKTTAPRSGRRALRAFRLLLADE